MDEQTIPEEMAQEQAGPEVILDAEVQAESNGQPASATETAPETATEPAPESASEPAPEPTPEEIIAQLEADLAAAQALAAESVDRFQRANAEFQNTSRRQEKRLLDSIDRANQALVTRLLPVMDDFDLAFANVPETLTQAEAAWITGFEQIRKKLGDALTEDGVNPIDDTGELFDPNRHEAISSEPNDEVESDHIIQTLRIGYEHKGRVLRPALVRVAM